MARYQCESGQIERGFHVVIPIEGKIDEEGNAHIETGMVIYKAGNEDLAHVFLALGKMLRCEELAVEEEADQPDFFIIFPKGKS